MKLLSFFIGILLCWASVAHSQELEFDGVTRTYRVHTPPSGENWPLVINMHGLGSNDEQQQGYTQMDGLADTEGFMVVYPKSQDEGWTFFGDGPDEVGFISAVIDKIASEYNIDLNRVYATGMSSGGYMSHQLGCELSDKIAAIAGVTGLLAYCPTAPARGVAVLQIHGTADSVVPYVSSGFGGGVAGTVENWINMNECDETPVSSAKYPDENSSTTRDVYTGCKDDVEVALMTVEGAGHVWMGCFFCEDVGIDATEEVWKFFKRFTLDGTQNIHESVPVNPAAEVVNNGIQVFYTANHGIPDNLMTKLVATNVTGIKLYDVSGNLIYSSPLENPDLPLTIRTGIFFLRGTPENNSTSFKLIVD